MSQTVNYIKDDRLKYWLLLGTPMTSECPQCRIHCTPTTVRPRIIINTETREVKGFPVRPGGHVSVSFTGEKDGRSVKCLVIRKVRANYLGTARVRLPKGLKGEAWLRCAECQIVSLPFGVET